MDKVCLLIDLDDVIYNAEFIPLSVYFDAIDKTAAEMHIPQEKVDAECDPPKKSDAVGVFNWIYRIVDKDMDKYLEFCRRMCDKIDYSRIEQDLQLYILLAATALKHRVFLATNNCRYHVEKIIYQRFGKRLDKSLLKCISIEDTLEEGQFRPKEIPGNLLIYANRANADPKQCILFDDAMANIECAQQVGMKAVHITKQCPLAKALQEVLWN